MAHVRYRSQGLSTRNRLHPTGGDGVRCQWARRNPRSASVVHPRSQYRANRSRFSLRVAAETVDADTWFEFLQSFQSAFQGKNISAFPGEFGVEETSKRETDYRFAGQSPFSPQIKYQVFYGIRDVLAPLVLNEEVSVWPLHQLTGTSPTLLEVYPAATFGRLCCYRTGYKGDERAEHRRRYNLDTLERSFNFGLEDPTTVIDSDNALDSLAAACAAASAKPIDWPDDAGVEGRICP